MANQSQSGEIVKRRRARSCVHTYADGHVTLTFKAPSGHSSPKIATILDAAALDELKNDLGKALEEGDSKNPAGLEGFLAIVRYSLKMAEGDGESEGRSW